MRGWLISRCKLNTSPSERITVCWTQGPEYHIYYYLRISTVTVLLPFPLNTQQLPFVCFEALFEYYIIRLWGKLSEWGWEEVSRKLLLSREPQDSLRNLQLPPLICVCLSAFGNSLREKVKLYVHVNLHTCCFMRKYLIWLFSVEVTAYHSGIHCTNDGYGFIVYFASRWQSKAIIQDT